MNMNYLFGDVVQYWIPNEELNDLRNIEGKLYSFCGSHRNIYVYGGGLYAEQCLFWLKYQHLSLTAIITSTGGHSGKNNLETHKATDILPTLTQNDGVICALKKQYRDEITSVVTEYGADLLEIDDYFWNKIKYVKETGICNCEEAINRWKTSVIPFENPAPDIWNRILLIQLETVIGDYIWATAFLRELRKNKPEAVIDYVISDRVLSLFETCPYIDNILAFPSADIMNEPFSENIEEKIISYTKETFDGKVYDAVFLLKALPSYTNEALVNPILALYCNAKTCISHAYHVLPYEIETAKWWQQLFPYTVLLGKGEHEVSRKLSMLRSYGLTIHDERMELWISNKDQSYANSFWERHGLDVVECVLAVGIRGREERRSWPPEMYCEMIGRLNNLNSEKNKIWFVLFGGDDAITSGSFIADENAFVIDMTGKCTLAESAALISMCHGYIGSDTSLMHMAAAFGKPIVELSANLSDGESTDSGAPERSGPWHVPGEVMKPERALDGCSRYCRRPYAHCITQIKVKSVCDAVGRMMAKNA